MAQSKTATLVITTERSGDDATLSLTGEIDLASSVELTAALAGVKECGRVLLDLSKVDYMDSSGLRVLLDAKDTLDQSEGEVLVVAASTSVRRLLDISGFADLLGDQDNGRQPASP